MVEEKNNEQPSAPDGDSADKSKKREINWDDPGVQVGNASPLPWWPVAAFAMAWAGWVTFLLVMLIST